MGAQEQYLVHILELRWCSSALDPTFPLNLDKMLPSLQLLFSLPISLSLQYVRHMIQGAEVWLKDSPESPFGN